jgi:hypothetical protein
MSTPTMQAGIGGATVTAARDAVPPPSPVTSVFGRVGAIVATLGDYAASLVTNDSGVAGATVKDALNTLAGLIPPAAPVTSVFGRVGVVVATLGDYAASLVTNDSSVAGATVKDALNTLAGAIIAIVVPNPSNATPSATAAAGSAGASADYSRADHVHASPQLTSSAPASVGVANVVGVATTSARADHVHAGVQLTSSAPANVTKAAASVGVATDAARSDHKHDVSTAAPVSVGTANAEGTATTLARSDHVHAGTTLTSSAPANVTKAAAAVGVATDAARSDHKHDVSTAAPVAVGTSNSEGTATTLARSDHVHTSLPFIVQSMEIARTTSTSTGSSSYSTLVSGTINLTAGRFLCFVATVGVRTSGTVLSNGEGFIEIRFNGTTYRSTAQTTPGNGQSALAITGRVAVGASGLVAGSNTIELRWRSTNGTWNVNPASDGEHAAIQLVEMSA